MIRPCFFLDITGTVDVFGNWISKAVWNLKLSITTKQYISIHFKTTIGTKTTIQHVHKKWLTIILIYNYMFCVWHLFFYIYIVLFVCSCLFFMFSFFMFCNFVFYLFNFCYSLKDLRTFLFFFKALNLLFRSFSNNLPTIISNLI